MIRVDSTTGLVDIVPVYLGGAALPETVTRYFLEHYIRTCERFNFSTAESDYEECGAFHTPQRNQLWYAAWAKTNPESPLNLYKGRHHHSGARHVGEFLYPWRWGDGHGPVRYVKARRQAGSAEEQVSHWIATLRYAYAKPSSEPKTRTWNPLGFKIVDLHIEPEVSIEGTEAKPVPPARVPPAVGGVP